MARGSVRISAQQGTGAHVSMQPSPHGPKASTFAPGVTSSKSMKAPQAQANSQRLTTAPAVKQPSVSLVRDTKPRTARERMVDAYNAQNPAKPGGNEYQTALEQQYARIAAAEKQAGTEQTTIKRKKQGQ